MRDIADHQRQEDYAEFFRLLPDLELFMSVVGPLPDNLSRGERIIIQPGTDIKVRTATLNGMEFLVAFTTSAHPNLGKDFAGVEGREALRMVTRSPNVGGLLVQSAGTGWVAFDRKKAADLLAAAK